MMGLDVSTVIASMKGVTPTGSTLSQSIRNMKEFFKTLEPGDIVRSNPPLASATPLAYDLWYLWAHINFMRDYYADDIDANHFDYSEYLTKNLSFLNILLNLKPLKVFRDLKTQLSSHVYFDINSMIIRNDWTNNGIYWINMMAFEFWRTDLGPQYPSDFNSNDYVGYITVPIGQLGVMEVISLFQETKLRLVEDLEDKDKPMVQDTPQIFSDMKDSGKNYCYGQHLTEGAYYLPKMLDLGQGVELFSSEMVNYGLDVKPKKWMRFWIHKDSTLPVPGEFLGLLCKANACPPHVWWFQESNPFLYAGNWVEVNNLTSGVVVEVILPANRTDGGIGNQYRVKIQGCEILVNATDFLTYVVGDRVAILKVSNTSESITKSFTWLDQMKLRKTDELTKRMDYVIIPITFYKGV